MEDGETFEHCGGKIKKPGDRVERKGEITVILL